MRQCPAPDLPYGSEVIYPGGMDETFAPLWVCIACHGPAMSDGETVTCVDDRCGVVRILPALPDRLPWEE